MIPVFTLKGFNHPDPLDKAPSIMRYALMMAVSFAASVFLVYAISDLFRLIEFKSFGIKVLEVVMFTIVVAPIIVMLRKSASWALMLIIFIPLFILDIYLQANVRDKGGIAWWTYLPGTFIDSVKILPLRFLMTLLFDSLIFAPICLWISRVIAHIIYRNKAYPFPTSEQRNNLFKPEWTLENVDKPAFDLGYWVLRILGFSYLSYLLILILGFAGASPWPLQIADLISMTYKNPALAINTFSKIGVMILLTFIGAYNIHVRYYCCWGLIVGHAVSTISSLVFYFYSRSGTQYRDFLLTSAIVDGVMIILFVIILIMSAKNTYELSPEKDYPKYFSAPDQLSKILFIVIAIMSVLLAAASLIVRFTSNGESGPGIIYGYPDPALGNTLTLYLTVAFISLLLSVSQKLRYYLFGVLIFPFFVGVIVTIPVFVVKDIFSNVFIITRGGNLAVADWYFMLLVAFNVITFSLLVAFRKLQFNVDYVISSVNPSSAKCVMGMSDAFFVGSSKKNTAVLRLIDQYIGGIVGRKRGLLNFPFWLIENVLNTLFFLHPNFSSMSREHQRWFLKKYMLRDQSECMQSFVPALAEFASQIGLAGNAMIMFANYSLPSSREEIGYVPYYARDRLQGRTPLFGAPFKEMSKLPLDEKDILNDEPSSPTSPAPFIAPRILTLTHDAAIPDEADYVVIGSGPGGAVAAYRLACQYNLPEKILIVERGNRYQPLQDFNDNEMEMMRKLYKEGGLQQTKKFTMSVLQGECVGGTSVINNAICIKMTNDMKSIWENEYDIDLSRLNEEYERIADEIEIKELSETGINQIVSSKFKKGVEGYNNNSEVKLKTIYPLQANYRNLTGDENWNLGNKRLTKRTMLETYLAWCEARGVNIIPNTTGVRFSHVNGKADRVLLRMDNGELKNVKINKALIVAGGVISSSNFLMRSNLKKNVGKSMSCNFAFPVTMQFEEVINAFDGNQITLGALDEKNRAIFETYFNPPASFALSSVPFYFDRRESVMRSYSHLINFGTLVGSEPNGTIDKKVDLLNGQAFSWELGATDKDNIKFAFKTILKLGYHAGATRAILPMKPGIDIKLSVDTINKFDKVFDDYPLRMEDLFIGTAHPQGGNIMCGKDSSHKHRRVIDENFCVDGYSNVYVTDASLFPVSIKMNPQWTIMAMSSIASVKILGK